MDKIYVYADFNFLKQTEEIGILSYERVRGNDHFSFEFSREWLSRHGDMILSGDVMNIRGIQHPRQGNSVFGFVKDSFPDRWGRILLDRRERLAAQQEQRPVINLSNYDYLVGIEDLTRMGGIRYSTKKNGAFINSNSRYCVPPLENLRALCEACQNIESAEERHELPEQRWLDQLVDPGSSLGGARPKANVMDTDGRLHVAKFPSKKDLEDTELIEHFSHVWRAKRVSKWLTRASFPFQRADICFCLSDSTEHPKVSADISLLPCLFLVLMMEVVPVQGMVILTLWTSSCEIVLTFSKTFMNFIVG